MSDVPPDAGAQSPAQPPSRMTPQRRRLAIAVVMGVLVVVAIVGIVLWLRARTRESTDDAWIEGNIVTVSGRVGGTVKDVPVEDEQVVAAGAVLAKIDPADYELALRKAEAEAADATAAARAAQAGVPITAANAASQLEVAVASVASARQDAEAASGRLADAKANHDRAAADLARYETLVAKDEISRQQYDTAVAAATSTAAAVRTAEAGLAASNEKVREAEGRRRAAATGPQQNEAAAARSEAAEATAGKNAATVEQAKLNLSYTTLTAPSAGIVSRKTVQPGQVIQPGQPLMALVSVEHVWVVANFKEGQLRHIQPGQPASVYVDAFGQRYQGHVEAIGGATAGKFSMLPAENASGNFVKVVQRLPVKIVLDPGQDPEHRLRPGMSVVPTVRIR